MFRPKTKFPDLDLGKNGYKGGKRIGVLMSGGPASGANAVISTFAIMGIDNGCDVIGFQGGYEYLQDYSLDKRHLFGEGEVYSKLTRDIVKYRNVGGSILTVSRANPGRQIKTFADLDDPEKSKPLRNILNALDDLGIGVLVTIGGDDTLKIANLLYRLGMPVVHVPKTIDNDYYGIPWTFGYWSAVQTARDVLLTLRRDAETARSWFVVEMMGRKAGWLTYGAGIAGETDLMLSAEDFSGTLDMEQLVDQLSDYIIDRERKDKRYGVICLAEGLVEKLPEKLRPRQKDMHQNIKLSDARLGDVVAESVKKAYKKKTGRKKKITPFVVGYNTRCVQPNSFDVVMSCMLGYGAYKLIAEKKYGCMVSVSETFDVNGVSFEELVDPETLVTKNRTVPLDSDFFTLQKMLSWDPVTHGHV